MSTLKAQGVSRCVWRQIRMAPSMSASTVGRLQVAARLVEHEFHAGIFQIDQPLQGGVQGQVGKTSTRSGNKHGQTPFLFPGANIAYRRTALRGNTIDRGAVGEGDSPDREALLGGKPE